MGKRTKHDHLIKMNQIINAFSFLQAFNGRHGGGSWAYDCMAAWLHVCMGLDSSMILNHVHMCSMLGQDKAIGIHLITLLNELLAQILVGALECQVS